MGKKRKDFLESHKGNKETTYPYAAKTDRLLVCGDFDAFFDSVSVTEHYGHHSGGGFESAGDVVCTAEEYIIGYGRTD